MNNLIQLNCIRTQSVWNHISNQNWWRNSVRIGILIQLDFKELSWHRSSLVEDLRLNPFSNVHCCTGTGTEPTHSIFPFRVFFSLAHSCAYQNNWRSLQCTICTKPRTTGYCVEYFFNTFTSLIKKFDADVINMCVKLQLKLETHVTYCSYPFCFVGAVVFGFSSKIRLWLAGLLFLFLFYH